ncbi:MAG: hypothetical protein V8T31_02955 [Lachnospiraceae bacterium]
MIKIKEILKRTEEKTVKSNYEKQVYIGRDYFLKYDQNMLIEKYGLEYDKDYLYLKYMGQNIVLLGRRDNRI